MAIKIYTKKNSPSILFLNSRQKKMNMRLCILCFLLPVFLLSSCSTFVRIVKEPEKIEEFPETTSANDPIYYDFIAKYFYNRKDYRQAIYFYEILNEKYGLEKEKYPEQITWTNYEIGFCYLQLKKYDLAEAMFKKVRDLGSGLAARRLADARLTEIVGLRKKL